METQETFAYEEALRAALLFFGGDELMAREWVNKVALKDEQGNLKEVSPKDMHSNLAHLLAGSMKKSRSKISEEELAQQIAAFYEARRRQVGNAEALRHGKVQPLETVAKNPQVTEVRPRELECDVVRFQNNKEKWVALVGLLNGYPYEIFTGLQDDDEGIILPKSVTKGKIVKQVNPDGSKRYDFQFTNTRGYKITVEGLSEKFNPEYWNYAKLISGVLRYRMPIEHVIKLVSSLQLTDENINTWKNGVERALKKYVDGGEDAESEEGEK